MDILGVRIDNFSKKEALEKISGFLNDGTIHQIVTINPEFVLRAQRDEEFRNILNDCDLNIADGTGIWFAFLRFGKYLKSRIAGVDLMEEILKIASVNNYKIFLAASDRGLSSWEETKDAILKKYPDLLIDGMNLNKNTVNCEPRTVNYDIVFCNFGAPYQEKFLYSLKSQKNGSIKITMGVGGSFDFLTGKLKRAPVFVRSLGLEWLFRLIQQPKRLKRIWNAVIIFPIKVIINGKGKH